MADYNRDRGYDDRGNNDWNRGRYGNRHENDYRGSYGNRGYDDRGSNDRGSNDRGFFERAGDEVRSWFGDDEAERRRRMDDRRDNMRERFDYDRGSDYRHNYGRQEWDSDRVSRDLERDDQWRRNSNFGDQGYNRRESDHNRTNYGSTTGYGGQGYGGLGDTSGYRNSGWGGTNYGSASYGTGSSSTGGSYGTGNSYGTSGYGTGNNYGGRNHRSEEYRADEYRGGGSWNRGRDNDWEDRRGNHRGPIERAGDEVRSWFGDDDAERRRRMDEQRRDWDRGRSDWSNDYDRRDGNNRW